MERRTKTWPIILFTVYCKFINLSFSPLYVWRNIRPALDRELWPPRASCGGDSPAAEGTRRARLRRHHRQPVTDANTPGTFILGDLGKSTSYKPKHYLQHPVYPFFSIIMLSAFVYIYYFNYIASLFLHSPVLSAPILSPTVFPSHFCISIPLFLFSPFSLPPLFPFICPFHHRPSLFLSLPLFTVHCPSLGSPSLSLYLSRYGGQRSALPQSLRLHAPLLPHVITSTLFTSTRRHLFQFSPSILSLLRLLCSY